MSKEGHDTMKVTDYIIEFLIKHEVTDIFGYPGGVICHLMDSATKYPKIKTHTSYNEQGAAFAACGYAQACNKLGVAYSTSGPGATNLVTGIANAYFDSIPTLFITGQVDTYSARGDLPIRQCGFQETDIVAMTRNISKFAICIKKPDDIKYYLEKAYYTAFDGNPGPIILDIPADVQRADVNVRKLRGFEPNYIQCDIDEAIHIITNGIIASERPCFLIGNGVKQAQMKNIMTEVIEKTGIPVVTSLPAFDILPYEHSMNFGFIGTNGHRYANFVLGKSDLIVAIGSRMDIRQVGGVRDKFASQAKLIRVDIDEGQLSYKVHSDEIGLKADLKKLLPKFTSINVSKLYNQWIEVCKKIKTQLLGFDDDVYNKYLAIISDKIPDNVEITVDVGQNQLWVAQSFKVKNNQSVHMSAGHGSMGYSLPAAIGVYYATKRPVYCFNGDGGIMMNIQELQFVKREAIPIKIICINNFALGMIRSFQERNFEKNYINTIEGKGYLTPDFELLAKAFGIKYTQIDDEARLNRFEFSSDIPEFVDLKFVMETRLVPNFGQNGLIQDQMPYIPRDLFNELMEL